MILTAPVITRDLALLRAFAVFAAHRNPARQQLRQHLLAACRAWR